MTGPRAAEVFWTAGRLSSASALLDVNRCLTSAVVRPSAWSWRAACASAGAVVCDVAWPGVFGGMGTALAMEARPTMVFPAAARERIAVGSYPFREFVAGGEEKAGGGGKMELKEFAAHVGAKF